MFSTENHKRISASSVQNLTTSGTAAISTPIVASHTSFGVDLFVRLVTTVAAYFNVIPRRSGTFTLNPNGGGNTIALDAMVDATTLLAALIAVPTIGLGQVTVTGTGTPADPFVITFLGTLTNTAVTLTKASTGVLNATVTLTEHTAGDATHNEVWYLSFTPATVVTATTGCAINPAAPEYIRIQPGDCISVLQVSAAGVVSIAVVEP